MKDYRFYFENKFGSISKNLRHHLQMCEKRLIGENKSDFYLENSVVNQNEQSTQNSLLLTMLFLDFVS